MSSSKQKINIAVGDVKFKVYNVYQNIRKMFVYRNDGTIGTDDESLMPEAIPREAFISEMNHKEFVIISGKTRHGTLVVMLLAPGSKYASRSSSFNQLMRMVPKKVDEVMIVSENTLSTHIHRVINRYVSEHDSVYVAAHTYKQFIIEVPKHVSVPEHTIMSEAEVQELIDEYYIEISNLQKILDSDPMAIWIGARAGDVIRIRRISEVAGHSIAYRLCVTKHQ